MADHTTSTAMSANPRPQAPDAGSALPTPNRDIRELFDIAIAGDRLARRAGNSFRLSLEKVAAFCRCSRSEAVPILRKIRRALDGAEAAIEAALADATPPARAAAGDGARVFEVEARRLKRWTDLILADHEDEMSAVHNAMQFADAEIIDALASGSAPSAGTVTLEDMAERGREYAGDLDDHDDLEKTVAIVRDAYGWALADDGRLCGLVSGDMGYAATSIVIGKADLDAWAFYNYSPEGNDRAVILARLSDTNTSTPGQSVRIGYVNWRGEATTPTIVPVRLFWGSNEWHPEPCWLLEAMDVEKQTLRTFDLRRIRAADTATGQRLWAAGQAVVNAWLKDEPDSDVLPDAVMDLKDALASTEADDGWRPIGEAKKDRSTPYLLKLKNPIPRDREDLRAWDGICFVGRHGGITPSGYDMGWQFAAPVGHGGFPDEWFDGFRPIAPPAPASAVGEAGR